MKKTALVVVIPIIAVVLLVGSSFAWKMAGQLNRVNEEIAANGELPSAIENAEGDKPANPFGGLFGNAAPTVEPTPTPASTADLNADLQTLNDDSGASDISDLQRAAVGL